MSPQEVAAVNEPAAPHAKVACAFPTRPGVAGHILACQLCPASPTYWRGEASADVCKYDKPAEKPEVPA